MMTHYRRLPSTKSLARRFAGLLGCVAAPLVGLGCAAGGGNGPVVADVQSVAEYDLAREAFEQRKLRESLDHVEKALKIDDENAEAAYLGANIMLEFCRADERSSDCRFSEAEQYARKTLDLQPDHRDAKNLLGVVLIHERRYDDAIAVLKPLANDILFGSPEKAWGNLGWAYLERGSSDEAIDSLRRAVAAQPLFCAGQYRLGLAYEKKGDLGAARDAFTKAIDTDRVECKRLQDAFDARARVSDKQGLREEARADLERCRDMASTTPVGQRCAAQLERTQ